MLLLEKFKRRPSLKINLALDINLCHLCASFRAAAGSHYSIPWQKSNYVVSAFEIKLKNWKSQIDFPNLNFREKIILTNHQSSKIRLYVITRVTRLFVGHRVILAMTPPLIRWISCGSKYLMTKIKSFVIKNIFLKRYSQTPSHQRFPTV